MWWGSRAMNKPWQVLSGQDDGTHGSWMPHPLESTPYWVVFHMLRVRHFLLYPWNWIAVASWCYKALCSILYPWKYCCISQDVLFSGIHEATEENVWNKTACNNYYAPVFHIYAVCCSLVAQEGTGLIILYTAVSCQWPGVVCHITHMQGEALWVPSCCFWSLMILTQIHTF